MVSPSSYPDQDLNPNSQIRILAPYSYNGFLQIERLEIKNRQRLSEITSLFRQE